jgi:S1-C subfamily serine protease
MRALVTSLIVALGAGAAGAQDKPEDVLSAVVEVRARASADARSAATLGTQRRGTGALIREGLVLTIGYLVIEAEQVQVTGADGRTLPATLAAYDHATGFGLLKVIGPMAGKPLPFGDAAKLAERERAVAVSATSAQGPAVVTVVSRRPFAGSWEYQLDAAIYTYPPIAEWSGAPLIGGNGELLGIGSLIVPDAGGPGTQSPGNMFVPVDILRPILEGLIANGRRSGPQQPWLGLNTDEVRGRLFVSRVSPESPAERAGIKAGDLVLAVGGDDVGTLAEFYRRVWARGAAGVEVPLRLLQGSQVRELRVRSIDRTEYFRPSKTR